MNSWATRAVFILAMLAPIIVGLWLYSFVFASPFGVLLAAAPPSVAPTATRTSGNEASTTTGAQLPQPIASATASEQQTDLASKQPPTPAPTASAATKAPPEGSAVPATTPTSVPVGVTAAPTSSGGQLMLNPVQTVQEFYRRINDREFDSAAELWTADMQRRFPPDENIRQRFAQTRSIRVEQARLTGSSASDGQATVAVELLEVRGTPQVSQRLSGSWTLVRGPTGWVLDQPSF